MVIFYRIAWNDNFALLQTGHGPDHRHLDIGRQGRGNAVGIDQETVQAFRLQKYLMSVAIPKAEDLVFDGGAVTRSLPRNVATEKRRTIQAAANDIMGFTIGTADGAKKLRDMAARCER